jgi:hypothetical protein
MNESAPIETPVTNGATSQCCAEVDAYVRRNPATALLVAVGAGLAIGLIVRALQPEPSPRQRAFRLLEDLEDRLRDAVSPAVGKAGALAQGGVEALQHGVQRGEARLERLLHNASKRFRKLLS